MSRIPGKPWGEYEDLWSDGQRTKAAKSLENLFAHCFTKEAASDTVDTVIIPDLHKICELERDDMQSSFDTSTS